MTMAVVVDPEAAHQPAAEVRNPGGASRLVFKGTIGLSAGRGIASLISAAWLVLVARHLSLHHFGDLAVLLALGYVFTAISDHGLQLVLAGHVAVSGRIERHALWGVLIRRQLGGALCAAITAGLYLLVADDKDPLVPAIFTVSILCTTVYQSALTAYRALGRVALDGANEVVSRLVVIGVGTWWLTHGGGLRAVVATYALADAGSAVLIYALVRRRLVVAAEPRTPIDLTVRATAPLALVLITQIVYYKIDTYLVGVLKGPGAAGLYGAAYRLLDGALIPAAAVASVIVAHTAGITLARADRDVRRYAGIALILTLPCIVVGCLVSSMALRDLFGVAFTRASGTAIVLLVSAAPSAVVAAYSPVAGLVDRKRFALGAALALLINTGGNVLLIPAFGLLGAAWVNVASQVFLGAWLVHLLARRARSSPSATVFVRAGQ
jgi:O-antigen/teichoic acid export membrane protein